MKIFVLRHHFQPGYVNIFIKVNHRTLNRQKELWSGYYKKIIMFITKNYYWDKKCKGAGCWMAIYIW
jgi:hypothetical protein